MSIPIALDVIDSAEGSVDVINRDVKRAQTIFATRFGRVRSNNRGRKMENGLEKFVEKGICLGH